MKRILVTTGIAVLALATVVGAQGYTFSTNLTVGSTGADVVALQTWLVANGYSIPAIQSGAAAKGYFGSQTKTAVKALQTAKGLPSTGFFGPLTRGVVNGGVAGGGTTVASCPVGYVCTPVSGGTPVTGTPGTITTPGAEGVITTKLAASPTADANIKASTNVPVWGIEVKAQGSDMAVDRVLLQIGMTVGGSSANPASFLKTVYAYDGSTLLKTWNLSLSDFNRDSSDRYYLILSGLRFVVPKDTTKVLTFKVDASAIASSDTSRVVTFQGYAGNTQNVRAVDGAGLSSYTDMSGSSNSRQQTFTASGSSSLTISTNSALTPKATSNKVDTSDGVKGLTMQVIDVKSTTGDSIIKTVDVATNATSSAGMPSTLYLYDGSTMVGSVSTNVVGSEAAFTGLTISIPKDTTKQLTIKADFPTTVNGQAASTSIPVSGIKFEKPDGSTASTSIPASALTSNDQYFFTAAPQWKLVSTSITPSAGVKDVASSSLTGTIVLTGTSFGGAMTKPVVGNFAVVFASSTQTNGAYTSANSVSVTPTITVTPTDATVGEGGTYTVTLTGTIYSSNTSLGSSQSLFMAVQSIDSTVGGNTITNQTWGLDDFFTAPAALTRGTY